MEPDRSNPPSPGQCGSDRDTFLRVWRRVMPEDTPACPIEVDEDIPAALEESAPEQTEPEMPQTPNPDTAGDDFPGLQDVPCLGSSSAIYAAALQEFIQDALRAWRAYQLLARRAAGSAGRLLSSLAAEEHRQAKRLSAALFLITGLRFWPTDQISVSAPTSYRGALREHFLAEQRMEGAYRVAAEDCQDMCLRALYIDLADECAEHAGKLRALLEML